MSLDIEQPPIEVGPEVAEYLERMFFKIKILLDNKDKVAIRTLVPEKPIVGKYYYFGLAIPSTPITAEGLYIYKNTGWVFIA